MKTINYKNIEWIVLEENEESKLLITKDILPAEIMKTLTGNDSQYCAFDVESNDYGNSDIRIHLKDFVGKYLNEKDLERFVSGDYARLITAEEVLKYDNELIQSNDWYWTSTPFIDNDMNRAWYVRRNGSLNIATVSNDAGYGVRPVICLKSNVLDEDKKIEKCNVLEHCVGFSKYENVLLENDRKLQDEINKLIDIINEMSDKNDKNN